MWFLFGGAWRRVKILKSKKICDRLVGFEGLYGDLVVVNAQRGSGWPTRMRIIGESWSGFLVSGGPTHATCDGDGGDGETAQCGRDRDLEAATETIVRRQNLGPKLQRFI